MENPTFTLKTYRCFLIQHVNVLGAYNLYLCYEKFDRDKGNASYSLSAHFLLTFLESV